MRNLLCEECGAEYREGRYCLLPATECDPAEWVRVIRGAALIPVPDQMVIYVNGAPFPLGTDGYLCDTCNKIIQPGAPATAVSIWAENSKSIPEPGEWEHEYIQY